MIHARILEKKSLHVNENVVVLEQFRIILLVY